MRRLSGLLLYLVLPAAAQAAEGASWLKIPQGARSVGMGTAVTALPGGAEGLWYNPASLGTLRGADLSVSRQAWLGQTRDDLISVAAPVGVGSVGIMANLLATNDTYRDLNGVEGGAFSDSAFAAGLAYGVKLGWLSLGATGKYLNEKIENSQGAGFGMDLGAQLQLGRTPVRLGASALNLGQFQPASASLGAVTLPQVYRVGVALDQLIPHLLITQELRLEPGSVATSYLAGAELAIQAGQVGLSLRGGYEAAAAQIGGLGGLALGAGVRFENLKVDFAYTPYGALGDPYRMSLGWDFAPALAAPPAPLPASIALPGQTAGAAPLTLDDKMNRGKAALAEKRYAEAETIFLAVAEEYPANARPYAALFKTYMDQGRKAEAIAALEKKLDREPDEQQRAWLERYKAEP